MAGKKKKIKEFRFATSFTMRFDSFTLEMLERIAYEEDKTRPEVIRAAVKFLFLKKYGQKELEKIRKKQRPDISKEG
jgi:predicted transcriptional regulator